MSIFRYVWLYRVFMVGGELGATDMVAVRPRGACCYGNATGRATAKANQIHPLRSWLNLGRKRLYQPIKKEDRRRRKHSE